MGATIPADLGAAVQRLGTDEEYWVVVPNQRLLEDESWQMPVIQACDPNRTMFKASDYGMPVIEQLCEKTAVNITLRDSLIRVDIKNMLEAIADVRTDPALTGESPQELDALLSDIFGEKTVQGLQWYRPALVARETERANELPQTILVLVASIALFVATGILLGTRVLVAV